MDLNVIVSVQFSNRVIAAVMREVGQHLGYTEHDPAKTMHPYGTLVPALLETLVSRTLAFKN